MHQRLANNHLLLMSGYWLGRLSIQFTNKYNLCMYETVKSTLNGALNLTACLLIRYVQNQPAKLPSKIATSLGVIGVCAGAKKALNSRNVLELTQGFAGTIASSFLIADGVACMIFDMYVLGYQPVTPLDVREVTPIEFIE